jgi:antirestriction protein ArdC
VPWVQPWETASAKTTLAMPRNAATRRQYAGINVLILWGAVIERAYPGQSWLAFRQALSLGGHVRKGECGTTVVYADRFTPDAHSPGRLCVSGQGERSKARALPWTRLGGFVPMPSVLIAGHRTLTLVNTSSQHLSA